MVVFSDDRLWQSQYMLNRFEDFARTFQGDIAFYRYPWTGDVDAPVSIELIPTAVLYRDGVEIDRIKGVPDTDAEKLTWKDDIELWLLKTALRLSSGDYAGSFVFRFDNSAKLQVGNY